jgi:hypothetical protein
MHKCDTSRSPIGRGRPTRGDAAVGPQSRGVHVLRASGPIRWAATRLNGQCFSACGRSLLCQRLHHASHDWCTGCPQHDLGSCQRRDRRMLLVPPVSSAQHQRYLRRLCSASVADILTLLPRMQALQTRAGHVPARPMENPHRSRAEASSLMGDARPCHYEALELSSQ